MPPITDQLIELAKTGKYLSRKYVRLKIGAVQKRERLAPAYLQRVKDCLGRIIEYAASKNVRIALESRRGYEEIPSERELPGLLDEMDSMQLGYWHDFGHSQIKENLGFIDHAEWLRMIGPRAFGGHVQDCIWPAKDHEAPFTGAVDFEKLIPLLPTNCLFVWEMSPNKAANAIRRSVQTWKERFGE
jgi:sugar phosphate isomerase/epimerase